MTEPQIKRIKCGQDFVGTINECYDLKFRIIEKSNDQEELLKGGLQRIRETLEKTTSSSDVSFGPTKTASKINWGKCLGLLLEDQHYSLNAIKVLTERLSPGGGLL